MENVPNEQYDFRDLIRKDMVFLGVQGGTWEELLRETARLFLEAGAVKESYADALIERETNYPTGLYLGDVNFAIPHTYPEHICTQQVAIVVPEKRVEFMCMEDPDEMVPVDLLVCPMMEKMDANVKILPSMMKYFAAEENIRAIISAADAAEVISLIRE